jgi:hypothetical protein
MSEAEFKKKVERLRPRVNKYFETSINHQEKVKEVS